MTKKEFLNNLDFEPAKAVVLKKFGIKGDVGFKSNKNGTFEIDVKSASNPVNMLLSGAKKATISATNVNLTEVVNPKTKEVTGFTYKADVMVTIKSGTNEIINKVGEVEFVKKFAFYTNAEVVERTKLAKEKAKADKEKAKEKAKADKAKKVASDKKKVIKKVEPKKVAPKKVESKKVAPKKVEPKKVEPKKAEPKKVEAPKKVEPKKVEPKKVEPKKVEVKPVEDKK